MAIQIPMTKAALYIFFGCFNTALFAAITLIVRYKEALKDKEKRTADHKEEEDEDLEVIKTKHPYVDKDGNIKYRESPVPPTYGRDYYVAPNSPAVKNNQLFKAEETTNE